MTKRATRLESWNPGSSATPVLQTVSRHSGTGRSPRTGARRGLALSAFEIPRWNVAPADVTWDARPQGNASTVVPPAAAGTTGLRQFERERSPAPDRRKFPQEAYQRLLKASERTDLDAMADAGRALEQRIRTDNPREVLAPPRTTDFAVFFLPIEGLYAEVLRPVRLVRGLAAGAPRDTGGPDHPDRPSQCFTDGVPIGCDRKALD